MFDYSTKSIFRAQLHCGNTTIVLKKFQARHPWSRRRSEGKCVFCWVNIGQSSMLLTIHWKGWDQVIRLKPAQPPTGVVPPDEERRRERRDMQLYVPLHRRSRDNSSPTNTQGVVGIIEGLPGVGSAIAHQKLVHNGSFCLLCLLRSLDWSFQWECVKCEGLFSVYLSPHNLQGDVGIIEGLPGIGSAIVHQKLVHNGSFCLLCLFEESGLVISMRMSQMRGSF